jgi:hypothetical protein
MSCRAFIPNRISDRLDSSNMPDPKQDELSALLNLQVDLRTALALSANPEELWRLHRKLQEVNAAIKRLQEHK